MKPGLSLEVQQSLKLSPQLQQAIHLLQLTCVELRQEILDECEKNPLLELDDNHSDEVSFEESTPLPNHSSRTSDSTIAWETVEQPSLKDHLLWQAGLSHFSADDTKIANAIIDSINDDGYLLEPLDAIMPKGFGLDEGLAVLHRIQHFDPIGVGATSLEECLMVQAEEYFTSHPLKKLLDRCISNYLAVIGNKGAPGLASKLHCSTEKAEEIIQLILGLNPKPGITFTQVTAEYIIPDAFIRKVEGKWQIKLNMSYLPKVNLQQEYASLVQARSHTEDQEYLKGHLQRAKWFLRALENRNQTFTSVLSALVRHQSDYFDQGDVAMRPLILQTLADELGFHPSTISRVTIGKHILTPHGIIPIKHLFSSRLETDEGGNCSAVAIKALIQTLIRDENKSTPLSDDKLSAALQAKGIHIARRTVAKYRESMTIPSARERRKK